jgi:hypothetical protein
MTHRTTGPILELGAGRYSTPFLHWACCPTERPLVTLDSKPEYFDYAAQFADEWHSVELVSDWDAYPLETPGNGLTWDLVFIDHDAHRRAPDAIRVASTARYVILHDTCGRAEKHYHYSEVSPHYAHRYHFRKVRPRTTVVSNFVDVSRIGLW